MMVATNFPLVRISRKRPRATRTASAMVIATVFLSLLHPNSSLSTMRPSIHSEQTYTKLKMSNDWADDDDDTSKWTADNEENWESNDGSSWSTFESSEEEGVSIRTKSSKGSVVDDSEAWLDTLSAISAEEITFNQRDNERADKARQMQEWGFDEETIKNTFGIATDDSKETADEPAGLKEYREDIWDDDSWEDEDYESIESHTNVEIDEETGEPVRQQMVYVDEHACIGCTNCATIADSTFFMESELGRARVYNQWGDTDDTVAMAIETCPVDCIHYVPYEELVELEIDRRGQNINFKARLVNQGESAHMASVGGGGFTSPQKISGNASSRCNNCPSRGCKNCPMFGVGKNPEFEKRERQRLVKLERRKLERERAANSKSAEL